MSPDQRVARPAAEAELRSSSPFASLRQRVRLRYALMALIPLALAASGVWYWLESLRYVSTDDASVGSYTIDMSAEVSGYIVALDVVENQAVSPGQVLLRIDPQPYEIALRQAKAQLEATRQDLESLQQTFHQREAEFQAAQETLGYEEHELGRLQGLAEHKVAPAAQLDQQIHAVEQARQNVASAKHSLAATLASLGGNAALPVEQNPRYLAAEAQVERAALDLRHTVLAAPRAGIVSRMNLQSGELVRAETPLFTIVRTDKQWIEADFKETQLTHVRPGQSATITIDAYPGERWHGVVASIAAATGQVFSVLPPENASGNWVKVVQRVAVRLCPTQREGGAPVLRAGMSGWVEIDTGSHPLFGVAPGSYAPPNADVSPADQQCYESSQ
jgi:membrane fusion protein, multidrug efflux system